MKPSSHKAFLVVGLGEFGRAAAQTLSTLGCDVVVIEADRGLVQQYAADFAKVIEADCTSVRLLRQLGVGEFQAALVDIGSDVEASILTVDALADVGLTNIWARASSDRHAKILERIGANHVVFAEKNVGEHIGSLLANRILDFIAFNDGFTIAHVCAPERLINRSLTAILRGSKRKIIVIGLKRASEDFIHSAHDTIILPGDELVVAGMVCDIKRFADE